MDNLELLDNQKKIIPKISFFHWENLALEGGGLRSPPPTWDRFSIRPLLGLRTQSDIIRDDVNRK